MCHWCHYVHGRHIPNHTPLGFKRDKKKLVPDPLTKDLVVRMYDLYLEGKSYQAIANIYNKEKVLGKTNWKDSTIGKIMTNELYKGDYLHGKKTKNPTYYENVVEPIVSKEKWDNCQYQKKRNARHYERTATYLFTNKLKCSECGRFLGGCATTKPNGKKYYYYKCKKCKTNYKEEEIKNGLLIQLYELIQKDNLINKYYTPFIKSKLDNNTEEFTKKIKELEKQKDRIKSAYMQGIVKMDEFGNELKSIEFNIEELEKKIKEQKQIENFNFTTNDLLVLEDTKKIDELIYPDKLMENILSLTNSPREEMKRIIATYIDNIEVNKVGEQTELKYIEYRKSFLADLVNFHNEYGVHVVGVSLKILMHQSGGIAFLAHAFAYSPNISNELLDIISNYELDGLECFYTTFTKEQSDYLVKVCEEKGMHMSGGSDFHGTRKTNHNLGTGSGNLCIDESLVKSWINMYLPDFNSSKGKIK